MPATLTGANFALDLVYAGAVYAGLLTVAPTRTTAGTETTYSPYARRPITFAAAASAQKANSADLSFATATTAGGTVTYVGIYSALTGGVLISYAQLTTPLVVGIGDTPKFPAGALVAKEIST